MRLIRTRVDLVRKSELDSEKRKESVDYQSGRGHGEFERARKNATFRLTI